MTLSNERVAWFNGKFLPESQVLIPFRDRSWTGGDGCFDVTRTFNGRIFRLDEHITRLYRSLKYLRIDPGVSPAEMTRLSEEVFERNRHLLGPHEDYWVGQRISRGVDPCQDDHIDYHGPNVIVECRPIPYRQRARMFEDGIRIIVPSTRRTPPSSLTPRAKTHNYLNLIVASQEVSAIDPAAWAILLDINGNLCEGNGSNIFLVKDGQLFTPQERYVLPGISRGMVMDLAAKMGLGVREADLDLYDAYNAEEIFITSTSLCLCPAVSINGNKVGPEGQVWGPVATSLAKAYAEAVECDFVEQYLLHRENGGATRPF
ncbi:branched-chain amino acid aminotransferase [Arboricoccus pini]|uniref:Probable branched-chain-amino-acid aminotransferase n=1 Tax=Arboricoccus pini TaxID=1963835 RepID=A0A212QQN3_9PROT|nr:aminotransferase class IV [Arboricoccus pini]SNB61656.1 branched-chain amino acid aminotransferase [Arboricoccus pini]